MYGYITLLIVMVSKVYGLREFVCNGTIVGDQYYDKQRLFKDFGKAYNLVMHELSDNLFFSHRTANKKVFLLQIVSCHMGSGICSNVRGMEGGYAIFYDRKQDKMYFGGNDGLYQYDFLTKSAKLVGARHQAIWDIFAINGLVFYIEHPSRKLYALQDGINILPLGNKDYNSYYVSQEGMHYYTNKIGELYKIKKPYYFTFDKEATLLSSTIKVRQIREDIFGDIYFCAKDGIYIDDESGVKKIADFDGIFGMTLVNKFSPTKQIYELIVIYSRIDGIHRAYPSEHGEYCLMDVGRTIEKPKSKYWLSFAATITTD